MSGNHPNGPDTMTPWRRIKIPNRICKRQTPPRHPCSAAMCAARGCRGPAVCWAGGIAGSGRPAGGRRGWDVRYAKITDHHRHRDRKRYSGHDRRLAVRAYGGAQLLHHGSGECVQHIEPVQIEDNATAVAGTGVGAGAQHAPLVVAERRLYRDHDVSVFFKEQNVGKRSANRHAPALVRGRCPVPRVASTGTVAVSRCGAIRQHRRLGGNFHRVV